jgi:type I restriction enzyme, S subunit
MMRMWQGAVGVSPADGLVSPAYVVASPLIGIIPEYFCYQFRTYEYMAEIDAFSRGIVKDRNRLYWDQFKQMSSIVPPKEEQALIVRMLNYKNKTIDDSVVLLKETIAKLTELKLCILNENVRGKKIKSKKKDSGLIFIGEVPEHWEVVRLKNRIGIQEGPGIMASDFKATGVPLIRIAGLKGNSVTLDGCNYLDPAKVKSKWDHFKLRQGDYLLSASGSTGTVCKVSEETFGAIPYTGLIRLWPLGNNTDMEFVSLFIESRAFEDQINLAKSGVGIEHFGPTHLKKMWLLLPPPHEQKKIVEIINSKIKPIDELIELVNRKLRAIEDFRKRTIADIIFGRQNILESAAKLPAIFDSYSSSLKSFDENDEIEEDI